jgi:beta-N-acetylhexosaminidase
MPSLEEAIGQLMMVGLSGEEITSEERSIFKTYPFGGFLLFSRNLTDSKQIFSLCRSLWKTGKTRPPLIAIDQEGGRVNRLPRPFTHFPSAAQLGRKGDPDLAYSLGRATARELALVGINLNFAPVLDVASNPRNPIIGDRSFGCEPSRVSALADAWMRGLRDGGIIPCGKHFPGHGDTEKDSHLDLPVVEKALEELQAVELPPFTHACRDQIESLMTAHVIYRSLDPHFPATLSQTVIGRLLRREIGYDGVVFSDDMEMKAVSDHYSLEHALALGTRAGVDNFLYCLDLSCAARAFEFLCREAREDPGFKIRVEESFRRIEKLKGRFLRSFTGVNGSEVERHLARSGHRELVDQVYGSL